jgi:hypothetical protein
VADITELTFVGDWRIVVQSRDAGWDQRVVAEGVEAGTQILGGSPGMTMDVYGLDQTPWTLRIEHNPGDGWSPNWLRAGPKNIAGAQISQVVESEDITTPQSDRDFNDLVVRLEKLGMVDQPRRPFAVWPGTVQMTPEGVFETAFGRYFLGVRVRNVWTEPWPAGTRVAITDRCRSWLAAGGVTVVDAWSAPDQAAVGQDVVGGRVLVGDLAPWESRLVYFKVDVSAAWVRKHQVEVAVVDPVAEDLGHLNRRARAPIFVSRTTYDSTRGVFVAECDRGTLTMAVKELVVDYSTLKRAIGRARELFGEGGPGGGGGGGGGGGPPGRGCSPHDLERLRRRLRAFLEGKDDDICAIWRELQCCCAGGGYGGDRDDDGDWTKDWGTGLEFFAWPTVFDYRIDYRPEFEDQFGPIPYDDPWWKVLLLIVAAILALAAFVSAAADLANRSADTVIGTVTRSTLNAVRGTAPTPPAPATTGSVDAAVVTLNGSRGLTASLFSYLDAAADEANTTPIVALGGLVNTPGTFLTNAQIGTLFANLAAAPPGSPAAAAAAAALRVFKSGARSGVTNAVMASLLPVAPRAERDGSTIFFLNQVRLVIDPATPVPRIGRPGDSGSLWLQMGSNAVVGLNHAGCTDPTATPPINFADMNRIEDVLTTLAVRF